MKTLTEYLEGTSPQPGEAIKLTEEEFSEYKRGRWNGPKFKELKSNPVIVSGTQDVVSLLPEPN